MIIAIDIGNTAITFGLFQGNDLILRFSLPSSSRTTTQKCWSKLQSFLSPDIEITGAICSSVAAEMTEMVRNFVNKHVKVPFKLLRVTDDVGIVNRYNPPQQLGIDRIVNEPRIPL